MPMRLLFYMVELWRDILKNTPKKTRKKKEFRLPTIIPMVLYNGKNTWTACKNFKEILNGYELFEENIIDFNYILFDINRYDKEELYELANLVSAIFLLDQEIDQEELIKRLRSIMYILKKISPDQFSVFKQWLRKILGPRLDKESQNDIDEVLDKSHQEEVDVMVHNLERTLDNIERKGLKKGLEQGLEQGKIEEKKQIAIKMLRKGLYIKEIMEFTDLRKEEIIKLRDKIKKNGN